MEKLLQEIKKQELSLEELNSRKRFISLTEIDSENIRKIKPYILDELPNALTTFYEKIRRTPQTMKFFKNEDHITHAKTAQESHWHNILDGNFNEDYARRVEKIGLIHAHIGLEPRWYIGGYTILTEHLVKHLIKELLKPHGFPKRTKMTIEETSECI